MMRCAGCASVTSLPSSSRTRDGGLRAGARQAASRRQPISIVVFIVGSILEVRVARRCHALRRPAGPGGCRARHAGTAAPRCPVRPCAARILPAAASATTGTAPCRWRQCRAPASSRVQARAGLRADWSRVACCHARSVSAAQGDVLRRTADGPWPQQVGQSAQQAGMRRRRSPGACRPGQKICRSSAARSGPADPRAPPRCCAVVGVAEGFVDHQPAAARRQARRPSASSRARPASWRRSGCSDCTTPPRR